MYSKSISKDQYITTQLFEFIFQNYYSEIIEQILQQISQDESQVLQLKCKIELDPLKIINISPDLFSIILKEAMNPSQGIICEIIHRILKFGFGTKKLSHLMEEKERITISIRMKYLPFGFSRNISDLTRNFNQPATISKWVSIKGCVSAIYLPDTETLSKVNKCVSLQCGNISSKSSTCLKCGSWMQEEPSISLSKKWQKIAIIPSKQRHVSREFFIILEGDDVGKVSVGERYEFIGWIFINMNDSSRKGSPSLEFKANNILNHSEKNHSLSRAFQLRKQILDSANRRDLWSSSTLQNWFFLYSITCDFGKNILLGGEKLFFEKLAIVLTVVSTVSSRKRQRTKYGTSRRGSKTFQQEPIHCIFLNENPEIRKLIDLSRNLSNHFQSLNNKPINTSMIQSNSTGVFIQGLPFAMAHQGILFIDNLKQFSHRYNDVLLQIMENGKYDVPRSELDRFDLPYASTDIQSLSSLSCNASVIVCNELSMKSYQSSEDNYRKTFQSIHKESPLIEKFDLLFWDRKIEIQKDDIMKYIQQISESVFWTEEKIKELFESLSNAEIKINKEAQNLLQQFYLISRRIRNSGVNYNIYGGVSMSLLRTMIKISCACAKICLREEVWMMDAAIAIAIVEETMLVKTGQRILSFQLFKEMRNTFTGVL